MNVKMTIGEIARIAGVSKTTVSRVLNNKPDVDPPTREKILNLIAKYDFHPNAFAKAISLQKSNHIGLIIPHKAEYVFSNPFYTEAMRGVSTEVDKQNYYLLICYAHEDNYLDIYRQKRVDGFVLLSPGSFHKNIIKTLNEENVPFVSTAQISDEDNMIFVDVDNFYGATLVMEHLVELGHRRIAYLGKPSLKSSQDRLNAYRTVLQKYNLSYDESLVLITDTSSVESGHAYTVKLLEVQAPPTAIFLANDVMAIGALKAIQERGLRVPQDISVHGVNSNPTVCFSVPQALAVVEAVERGLARRPGPGSERHAPGMHDHGMPPGRLDPGGRQARPHPDHFRGHQLGGGGCPEEGLCYLPEGACGSRTPAAGPYFGGHRSWHR
jgi:LacI family transcriptional regulator